MRGVLFTILAYSSIYPQAEGKLELAEFHPQAGGGLFRISWRHHKNIMDKCGGDTES